MYRKILPLNILLRYGLELTNPASPRGQLRMVWALGISLTLAFSFFLIIGGLQQAYGRREEILRQQTPLCHSIRLDLGPVEVNRTQIDLEELDTYAFSDVYWGGQYSPRNCIAQDTVAIIVPYRQEVSSYILERDRQQHLPIFLNHMHQFLMKQQIEYRIFIVEQAGHDYFNRGKLLNVGFAESQLQKAGGWQCFIFHDIDLLPLDQRNLYYCPHPRHPRHLAVAVGDRDFQFLNGLDGVSAMTLRQFTDVNGFSNAFWGQSGENEDMVWRIKSMGNTIWRYNASIARYASLQHKPAPRNKNNRYKWYNLVMDSRSAMRNDGLSTLNYTVHRVVPHRLYTHILVNIGRTPNYYQMLKILKKYKFSDSNRPKQSDLERIKEEFAGMF